MTTALMSLTLLLREFQTPTLTTLPLQRHPLSPPPLPPPTTMMAMTLPTHCCPQRVPSSLWGTEACCGLPKPLSLSFLAASSHSQPCAFVAPSPSFPSLCLWVASQTRGVAMQTLTWSSQQQEEAPLRLQLQRLPRLLRPPFPFLLS
jgi:hypothetical protein